MSIIVIVTNVIKVSLKKILLSSALLVGAAGVITVTAAPSKALIIDPVVFTNLDPVARDLLSGIDYTSWNITNSTGKKWTDFHIDCGSIGCTVSPFKKPPLVDLASITFKMFNAKGLEIEDGSTFNLLDFFFGATKLTVSANTQVKINPTTDVPTPLPIVGLGAAFAYSRRIRKRITHQRCMSHRHTTNRPCTLYPPALHLL